MTAAVLELPAARRGRPSNAWLTERVERLARLVEGYRLELHALRRERRDFASEVRAACRRMEFAVMADRPDVALHVSAQLMVLAERHERRSGDAA